jgi:glycosyltransferase involved in cell wall biosynthesis
MTHPSVSVVIPAYRAARTISRAVDSVLAQTRPPTEIMIVDDGSPDEEELLVALEPYRHRITRICQPNGGAASARNLGIDRSRGELLAFLDADDYWEPTKLERQLDVFRSHPEVGLVSTRFFHQEPGQPRVDSSRFRREQWFGKFPEDRLLMVSGKRVYRVAMAVWTSSVIVRREILGENRFESGLEPAEDRDLWIRLIAANPVYILSEPLATAVLEPGSLSRSNIDADYTNMIRVIRRHGYLLKTRERAYWEGVFFRLWASCHLGGGRPRAALRPAWERLRRDCLSAEGWWIMLKSAVLACSRFVDGGSAAAPQAELAAPAESAPSALSRIELLMGSAPCRRDH